jgi:hypothetical protein
MTDLQKFGRGVPSPVAAAKTSHNSDPRRRFICGSDPKPRVLCLGRRVLRTKVSFHVLLFQYRKEFLKKA